MDPTLNINIGHNLDNNSSTNSNGASNVSNLSNALRSVNLGHNSNTATDQSNIDFENIAQQQQQQQQQLVNNSNNSDSNENNINNNINNNNNNGNHLQNNGQNDEQNNLQNSEQNNASTTQQQQQQQMLLLQQQQQQQQQQMLLLQQQKQYQSRLQQYNSRTPQQPSKLQQHYTQQQIQQEEQQQQQQQLQQQQQSHPASGIIPTNFAQVDSSRITKFFDNQPLEGYTLFSHRSAPNGFKVAIILSELNMHYRTFFLDFNKGEHRCPEFIAVNPNARVPALIDHTMDNLPIWESGAIIMHLVNKFFSETGQPLLWSNNIQEQAQINSWLFFQTSGHAPMIGQALHFKYFHTNKIQSAVDRYTDEVRRVYGVVEMALAEKRESLIMDLDTENAAAYSAGTTPMSQSRFFDYPVWLVGEKITIADLSFVPWNNVVDRIGINIKVEFPEVYKWTKHMMRRPAVIKALRGE